MNFDIEIPLIDLTSKFTTKTEGLILPLKSPVKIGDYNIVLLIINKTKPHFISSIIVLQSDTSPILNHNINISVFAMHPYYYRFFEHLVGSYALQPVYIIPNDQNEMLYIRKNSVPISIQIFLQLPILITLIILVLVCKNSQHELADDLNPRHFQLNTGTHLPLRSYQPRFMEFQASKCPICLTDFVVDELVRCLPCNHYFHRDCVDTWFESNNMYCPLCRKIICEESNMRGAYYI
ncbi:RING-H2 finger protein ATL73 [Astathelohania contejeani]|uniref:RING-H2 finger protein ATL73 n=1 Tax=Astathelohania contejeani TaxID=164912 RepID=A0ABQ7HYF3_9MICR|nr:RING-H2 finger protein ATL73 [Thelohania contejeani]